MPASQENSPLSCAKSTSITPAQASSKTTLEVTLKNTHYCPISDHKIQCLPLFHAI